jgi:hypothetical protein
MVANATRQMLGLAPYSDFISGDRHRRCPGVELATDAVRDPEYRYDCAFSKRHGLAQSAKAGRDPFAFGRQKAQALARRHATRQDQLHPAFGGIDPQCDPPRPRADPNRNWSSQIERRHLAPDIVKSQFFNSCAAPIAKPTAAPKRR